MGKKDLDSGFKKKGNAVLDTIMVIVVLFVFAIATFSGNLLFNDLNDDIQADSDMSNATKEIVQTQNTRYSSLFDGLFIFFLVLMWALIIVASFNIDAHPVFFIFTVILLIFVFILAAIIGNSYEEMMEDPDYSSLSPNYPMTDWIMTHLLNVAIVMGFSVVLVLFGKNRSG